MGDPSYVKSLQIHVYFAYFLAKREVSGEITSRFLKRKHNVRSFARVIFPLYSRDTGGIQQKRVFEKGMLNAKKLF